MQVSKGVCAILTISLLLAVESTFAKVLAAEKLYQQHCATCHNRPAQTRAPSLSNLQQMQASRILKALEFGRMQQQGAALSAQQRQQLANFLSTVGSAMRDEWITKNACKNTKPLKVSSPVTANWGFGAANLRHITTGVALNRENVSRLKLKWSLAVPGGTEMRSQPAAVGHILFFGTANGNLLALDQASGCVHWRFRANSTVRSAINLNVTSDNVPTLFFADDLGTAYAVEANTGSLRWQQSLRWFPTSVISGSLAFHDDSLYVPISSFEVAVAGLDTYSCCRSHGGVAALDAMTGKIVWEYHNTSEAKKTKLNKAGTQMWGPSGAAIWTTPTIDTKRNLLYVGSGENTSLPATDTSDAVIALDLDTGKPRWSFQALANDVWNGACQLNGANCPENAGPDFDFGGAISLAQDASGKDYVLAGQKSGELFALDPDKKGRLIWRQRLSMGTSNGGIHWGVASDKKNIYVTIADPPRDTPGYVPRPGIFAVALKSGEPSWSHSVKRGCEFDPADAPQIGLAEMRSGKARDPWPPCSFYYGQSAAPLLANGVIYAGALDGKLRILASDSGKLLKVIDTNRSYKGSNGIDGHGGAIDLSGVVVHGERLFVSSGYGMFGQMPGNMLLVYEVEDGVSPVEGHQNLLPEEVQTSEPLFADWSR
ncbi:MAG: PQQ-binding-like beta-propeller repeat protein [Pseudomonadales bacterium]